MGLMFFPRGGSAHVARNLATRAPGRGLGRRRIVSGSLSLPGRARRRPRLLPRPRRAPRRLYAPRSTRPTRCSPTRRSIPPSRTAPGAPDRVFASLDDAVAEHLAASGRARWRPRARAEADVLHLHHLTPLNEAAARVAPDVPVVGHLHGTELLMLEAIEADPGRWEHGAAWAERMRRWAARCERLLVLSDDPGRARRAAARRAARAVRGGPQRLRPRRCSSRASSTAAPTGPQYVDGAGGLRRPVLLYVGRFTAVKRVPLLIEAYVAGAGAVRRARAARARRRLPRRVGGRAPGGRDRAHGRARRPSRRLARARRARRASSTPPTSSSWPRWPSSSARCWSRGWRARGR